MPNYISYADKYAADRSLAHSKNQSDLFQALMGQRAQRDQQTAQLEHDASKQGEVNRHNLVTEGTADMNARSSAGYHNEMVKDMAERRKVDKLKLLLNGGAGGAGTGGLPQEAQKVSNLVDASRSALNNTEKLATENPKTAAFAAAMPQFVVNPLAGVIGGKLKEINDSVGMTRESMQNVKTGAAATGQQAASFQNWSMPGAWDILKGKAKDGSTQLRDDMNIMQQTSKKQAAGLSPEMANAAGMGGDPMVKQAMQQQQQARDAQEQARIGKMAPEDQELFKEIKGNPAHPNAGKAKQYLSRQYGGNF